MFNSVTSSPGKSSNSWDTGYARKFLQIPEDQQKVLDNFPVEKLTTVQKINNKQSGKDIVTLQIAEAPLSKQPITPVNAAGKLETYIQDTNLKEDLIKEKKQFLDYLSLSENKTITVSSTIPKNKPSRSDSGLQDISFKMTTEINTFPKSSEKHQLLNTTYVVPNVLDDKTNNISDNPVKNQVFEKLDTQILHQDPSSPNVPKFGGQPVFPANPAQKPVNRENFLSKKLKLLEKRFSPSKDFSLITPSEEYATKCNLISASIHTTKAVPEKAVNVVSDDLVCSMVTSKSLANIANNKEGPISVLHSQVPEKNVLNTVNTVDDKSVAYCQDPEKVETEFPNETQPSQKKYAEEIPLKSNTSVFEEESFISQPFPCGQPPSNTQFSAKAAQNQGAESVLKESTIDKVDVPSDVFYEKCGVPAEVIDSAPVKVGSAGGKRKRKSKTDKPSKRLSETKSLVCIQYTAKQVENMIGIMRKFPFEK